MQNGFTKNFHVSFPVTECVIQHQESLVRISSTVDRHKLTTWTRAPSVDGEVAAKVCASYKCSKFVLRLPCPKHARTGRAEMRQTGAKEGLVGFFSIFTFCSFIEETLLWLRLIWANSRRCVLLVCIVSVGRNFLVAFAIATCDSHEICVRLHNLRDLGYSFNAVWFVSRLLLFVNDLCFNHDGDVFCRVR